MSKTALIPNAPRNLRDHVIRSEHVGLSAFELTSLKTNDDAPIDPRLREINPPVRIDGLHKREVQRVEISGSGRRVAETEQ